jgi:hypothetical protein
MQEHQRRQIVRAFGFIAEAAVVGFHGLGIGHQGLRCGRYGLILQAHLYELKAHFLQKLEA